MKHVYTIGAAAEKIESQIKGTAEIVRAGTLETAVNQPLQTLRRRCCALAPACASFDQFDNYRAPRDGL